MADKNDGGDKTEKPTPKRLKDARKKGDVPKSKEITSTVVLIGWLVVAAAFAAIAGERITALIQESLSAIDQPFDVAFHQLGAHALREFAIVSLLFLIPVIAIGLLTEFLQAGPVLSFEKMKPTLDKLNPAEGIKRMFSVDNAVEIAKLLAKTLLLVAIAWIVLRSMLADIAKLQSAHPAALGDALRIGFFRVCALTVFVFVLVAILDAAYQRHSFMKKLRMSLRDIRQEMKDNEGDPYVKARRRQLHHEWAQRNSVDAARKASVLVVNPTHIAIALDYDPESCPLPVVSGKGEADVAQAMRDAAEQAEVPIIQQIDLAHSLNERAQIGAVVPTDLFDAVAQVILWAREQTPPAAAAETDEPAPAS